jgi:hypothetical protein
MLAAVWQTVDPDRLDKGARCRVQSSARAVMPKRQAGFVGWFQWLLLQKFQSKVCGASQAFRAQNASASLAKFID